VAQVHHRNDQDFIRPDVVEQAERKPANADATGAGREGRPRLRMRFNQAGGGFDFAEEFRAQAFLRRLVIQPRRFYRAVPAVSAEIIIPATSGVVTAPCIITNGYIYQTITTVGLSGGRAAYNFTIITAGNYVIAGMVNALDGGENSFFVNIDAEPQGDYMLWDISPTSGFQQRTVSWYGNGPSSQFVPKVFNLGQGPHQLIIRGREANTLLQSVTISPYP